jgi:hypothetical protein
MPIARATACALLACLPALVGARADIIFCSQFPYLINTALAYPQTNNAWISRGWLNVESGKCFPFDTTLNPKTFYYRGESESYKDKGKTVRSTWGAGMQFAIKEASNFNYWNAQTRILDSVLAQFSKGIDIEDGVTNVTVTFGADGKVSFESVKP